MHALLCTFGLGKVRSEWDYFFHICANMYSLQFIILNFALCCMVQILLQYKGAESVHTDYTAEKDRRTKKGRHAGRHTKKGGRQKYRQTFKCGHQVLPQTGRRADKNQSGLTHILFLIHIHGDRLVLTWQQPRPHCTCRWEEREVHCISTDRVMYMHINIFKGCEELRQWGNGTHTHTNAHTSRLVPESAWCRHINIQRLRDIKVREEARADRP